MSIEDNEKMVEYKKYTEGENENGLFQKQY